jgi:hypothetical protein
VVVGEDWEAAGHYPARRCLGSGTWSRRIRATSFRPSRIEVSISSGVVVVVGEGGMDLGQ